MNLTSAQNGESFILTVFMYPFCLKDRFELKVSQRQRQYLSETGTSPLANQSRLSS